MELTKMIVLAILQLTAVCTGQKFGAVYRRPVVPSGDKQIATRQQYATPTAAIDYPYQPQQLSALEQFYQQQQAGQPQQQLPYYPQQQKKLLEQQQQYRLQQQQLQLQQLQQLQFQQQQPLSSSATAAYYQPQQQQQLQQLYNDFYQQQLQQQQLQLQQQQPYHQQKPLFKPAIPVTETSAEDRPQIASLSQASQQQVDPQNSSPNLLGVLYSSAADVSKFQFSGNGVNYSF